MRFRVLGTVALIFSFLLFGAAHSAAARVTDADADRAWVYWLMLYDPRATVRAAATTAFIDEAQDEAIARFLASDYDFAVRLAQETDAVNSDFARRVLDTYLPQYSPEVHAAARQALAGTAADRAAFVRTAFPAAQARDRQAREASGAQKAALVEADRAFVRQLGATDPGAQVRAAAGIASAPGAGDDDLVEFFAYGWSSAGRLDLDMHRTRIADSNTTWRATARRLVAEAEAAQRAALEASGEAAVKLRESAAQAWRTVGDQTTPARSAWAEAEELALRQAENWRAVAAAARAATGPNWQAIGGPAASNETAWAGELDWAREQAAYWQELLQQAEAGEKDMIGG